MILVRPMAKTLSSGLKPGVMNFISQGVKIARIPQMTISKTKKQFKTLLTSAHASFSLFLKDSAKTGRKIAVTPPIIKIL